MSHTDKCKPQIALCCNELQFRLERCSQLHSDMWLVAHLSASNWPCFLVAWKKNNRDTNYILFLSLLGCMYVLFIFIFLFVHVNSLYLRSIQWLIIFRFVQRGSRRAWNCLAGFQDRSFIKPEKQKEERVILFKKKKIPKPTAFYLLLLGSLNIHNL